MTVLSRFVLAAVVTMCGVIPLGARADTTGTLAGIVVDGAGKPVSGAVVSVNSPAQVCSTTTDARGNYAIVGLIPGAYTVSVTKSGYEGKYVSAFSIFAGAQAYLEFSVQRMFVVSIDGGVAFSPARLVRSGTTADVYVIPHGYPLVSTQPNFALVLQMVPGIQIGMPGMPH